MDIIPAIPEIKSISPRKNIKGLEEGREVARVTIPFKTIKVRKKFSILIKNLVFAINPITPAVRSISPRMNINIKNK